MLDALDEWARKRVGKGELRSQLRSDSGVTPESLRIDQSQTRSRRYERKTNKHDDFSPPVDLVRLNFQKQTIISPATAAPLRGRLPQRDPGIMELGEPRARKLLRERARSISFRQSRQWQVGGLAERLEARNA